MILNSPLEIYGSSTSLLEIDTDITSASAQNTFTYSSHVLSPGTPFGTLILSGSNSYPGLTTINGGVLELHPFDAGQVGGPSISADLLVNSNNAAVVASPTSSYSVLSADSNVQMIGGNFQITAYPNGIAPSSIPFNSLTINELGIFQDLSGAAPVIALQDSVLPLNMGASQLKVSKLTLVNGGSITYQTTSPNGTEAGQALITGSTSPITVDLNGNPVNVNIATLSNPSFDMIFNSATIQNGSLTKIGEGNLLFNGTGSIPALTINAGKAVIGNASTDIIATTGATQVGTSGTLFGLGTLGSGAAALTNSGLVQPGLATMIGRLTISGSYIQATDGTFLVRAFDTSTADQLVVNTGGVALNGGILMFQSEEGAKMAAGNSFVVIDNTGGTGVVGQFSALVANLPPSLTASIQYTSNQVIVNIAACPACNSCCPVCPNCPACNSCCPSCPICPVCPACDSCCPSTSLLAPPRDLHAKVIKNAFASQADLIVRLKWKASPSRNVTDYLVYRNGKLIGIVGASDPLVFEDHNRSKHHTDKYQVTAIEQSEPDTVKVKLN